MTRKLNECTRVDHRVVECDRFSSANRAHGDERYGVDESPVRIAGVIDEINRAQLDGVRNPVPVGSDLKQLITCRLGECRSLV